MCGAPSARALRVPHLVRANLTHQTRRPLSFRVAPRSQDSTPPGLVSPLTCREVPGTTGACSHGTSSVDVHSRHTSLVLIAAQEYGVDSPASHGAHRLFSVFHYSRITVGPVPEPASTDRHRYTGAGFVE